jgi:GH18 family chitinase
MICLDRIYRWMLSIAVLCLSPVATFGGARVVAYVPNWIDLPAFAETIDYAKITHLNVAFENPVNDGGELSFNPLDEALLTKARAKNVPVLVSLGGGSASEDRKMRARFALLLADGKCASFVAALADYVVRHGFAGLDVDLEGPAIDANYGTFVAGLAAALKPKGKLLTAALSQGYGGDKVPDAAFAHFDFVNVMAYDATGPWNPKKPGQHSSLEFARETVSYWLARGLPKEKIVLGVPFYGWGFGAAFRKDDYAYSAIVAAHRGAEKVDQAGETIWYNGLPTIRAKVAYVKERGLCGVMIWSLDQDAKGAAALLPAIHDVLHGR